MSGLYYAFIPDRVDLSALMHCQTHSLGNRRAFSIHLLSLLSAIFTFPSATYFPSPCLLFSSCPHQLLPSNYSLPFEFGPCLRYFARMGFLFIFAAMRLREAEGNPSEIRKVCVSACFTERSHQYGNVSSRLYILPVFFLPPVLPLRQHFSASFSRIGSCSPQQWPSA